MQTQHEDLFHAAEQRWLKNWRQGPTRRRWIQIPLQVGDSAPDYQLADSTGQLHHLNEYWKDSPGLLIFWRHFGCGCGVGRAERLQGEYKQLVDTGANVVVVGQGDSERAAWYKEKYKVPCTVLVDPDEHVYRSYNLLETSPWLLLGKAPPEQEYFENIMNNHRAKGRPVADNPFLLPGEFVINTRGKLVLTYRYQYCDNYPSIETLVNSINEARNSTDIA